MIQVTNNDFYKFFEDKEYTTAQGIWTHSENFIVDNRIVGCVETSSYNNNIIYQLEQNDNK